MWLAIDGARAARPFLLPLLDLGIIVVSRLREDASLLDLPPAGSHGNRIYGKNEISQAKRTSASACRTVYPQPSSGATGFKRGVTDLDKLGYA